MSDKITIKSIFREYSVNFVNDFIPYLKSEVNEGAFIVIDSFIINYYKHKILDIITPDKYIVVEANEYNKTIAKCTEIIEILVDRHFRKNQKLIAIGGGVIQDLTAFTASIIYRGVEWVFFPTTLLAQGDSCIGSKTSINIGDKKNLIGNFYPPSNIFIDINFLDSLISDDIKSGIGEMLHFYFYANSPLSVKLIANYDNVLRNRKLLIEYIMQSLAIKKSVIELDEFDKEERNKFNYGHTFGHAIESVTGYRVKHGQGVTVGMDIANYVSTKFGLVDKAFFDKMHSALLINFPIYNWEHFDLDAYFDALTKDKKNIGESLVCILSEGPGKLVKKQLPFDSKFKGIINNYFKQMSDELRG